ncbi:DNA primase [Streptomyces sp. NPDC005708]|uniref:DNA primase n=1 Tax=Streptomyces sp. NPDC005708 TaxID=3154564 RepID=UPI0033D9FBF9
MMNRTALGLAIGAGYVLGRTKKMKLALGAASLVAGKRMQLSPRAIADLVNQQLLSNPQFKEISDQLRHDLRGVGKAASGALLERQIEGIAGRLHDRTSQVRDQISGVPTPDLPGLGDDEDRGEEEPGESDRGETEAAEDEETGREKAAKKAPGKKGPPKKGPARKTPGPKAAKKTAAKKAPAKKAAAKKTATAKGGERRVDRGSSGEGRR